MSIVIISVAAFMGVATLVAALAMLFGDYGNSKVEERLGVLMSRKGGGTGAEEEAIKGGVMREEVFREGMDGIMGVINNFARKFGNLNQVFEQADSPIGANTFLLLSGGFAFVGVAIAAAAQAPYPLYPPVGLMTGSLPLMWLLWRRSCRLGKFGKQLPDALEMIGRALRSGNSLAQAIKVVVEEMPAPISTEFGIVYEAQNLNVPLDLALKDMFKRVPNMDLKFFVTSVAIQRQTGGDLAEILDKIGHIVRERFKILGQVQALTGEGRISGIVLMALPIALFFGVYYMNPDYMMLLFTDPLGRKMIAAAVVLQILGAIVIKKIVNIKV